VHDAIKFFDWNVFFHGRRFKRCLPRKVASKHALVQVKGLGAVAIEGEVTVGLHGSMSDVGKVVGGKL
jgi:hypothetical protein